MRTSSSWYGETAEMLVAWRQPAGMWKTHSTKLGGEPSCCCHCCTDARACLEVDVAQYIPMRCFFATITCSACASVIRDVRYVVVSRDSSPWSSGTP